MTDNLECTIGTLGQKWDAADKKQWFAAANNTSVRIKMRLLVKLMLYLRILILCNMGRCQLMNSATHYFALKSKHWQSDKSTVLVSGGVHGYETSGVQGALRFLENEAANLGSDSTS